MSAFNTGALNPLPASGASPEKRVYEPSMEEILASIRRIIADDQSLPGRGGAERDESPHSDPPFELRRAPTAAETTTPPQRETGADPASPAEPLTAPEPSPSSIPRGRSSVAPEKPSTPTTSSGESSPAAPPAAQRAHGTISAPQYAMPDQGFAEPADGIVSPLQHLPEPPQQGAESGGYPEHGEVASSHQASQVSAMDAPSDGDDRLFDEPIEPPPQHAPVEAPSLFSAATDTSVSTAFNMLAASRLADNSDELMTLVREMIRPLLRNWLDDNLPSMVERMVRAEIERVARGGR